MIGHNLTQTEIDKRIKEHWNMGKFPTPKFTVKCPVCSNHEIIIRQETFNARNKDDFRCSVWFKCTMCSMVWMHGVLIPEWVAELHGDLNKNTASYDSHQMKKELAELEVE